MGAAGARAAQVLATAGLRVVGVEAGGWLPGETDWFERTLPRVRRGAGEAATPPSEPAPMANAVGGSNHRSARQSYRLDIDTMPGEWPLTGAELVPYYERVERATRVRPSPPAPWTERMRKAAGALGWEVTAAPVATAPPLGLAELGTLVAGGQLEVLTESLALRLLTDSGGAAVGAEILRRGERERIDSRRVVLAAHTFENVRLLLLSRSAVHPEGIGNTSGRVGQGFATHNLALAYGHFVGHDLGRRLGAPGQAVAVEEFDRLDPGRAHPSGAPTPCFRGGSILQAAMGASDPAQFAAATSLRGAGVREVGSVWAQPEQLPRPANRLELDPSRLDSLGRSLLLATHGLDAEDRRRADFLLARMEEWLRAAGAARTWRSAPRPNALSTHAYGGTTMGTDPAASVVDRFGEVHDAPGLFVLGASTFPATGGRGPTETIEALAWRTAHRIVGDLGR
jgi:gluconate 2-dehydrogenase alpha chain